MRRSLIRGREGFAPPVVGMLLIIALLLMVFTASAPWDTRTGLILLPLGLLMVLFRPTTRLPNPVLILAAGLLVFGLAPFLPVGLTGMPDWRRTLEDLGMDRGDQVVMQSRHAWESYLSFALTALAALWVLSLRFSIEATRNLALLFVAAVASYALLSKGLQGQFKVGRGGDHFGFFPNRNHTGNLLAIAFVCGSGLVFQALRHRHYARLALGILCNAILLWAILSWNYSRAAPLLVILGGIIWVLLLGWRYFGRQELKVGGLFALLAVGIFTLSDFDVKERISETADKITLGPEEDDILGPESGSDRLDRFDLRVPIMRDTLGLIAAFPLTGVGSGQFRWVFPQYRDRTSTSYFEAAVHPESSWLWLASEWGSPAALCLLTLVGWLYYRGYRNIRRRGKGNRALRFGCLVASAMVPFHACFDVPAHRPALLLASLFLFVISQNHSPGVDLEDDEVRKKPLSRGALAGGVLLIVGGLAALFGQTVGLPEPVEVKSRAQLQEGAAIYEEILAAETGFNPMKTVARRREVVGLTTRAIADLPLDGRFYRLRGLAHLPLTFRIEEVRRDFALDRALSPNSWKIPLVQAAAAVPYDRALVEQGWREALVRAERIDDRVGGDSNQRELVIRAINLGVRRVPSLKPLARRIIGESRETQP